MRKILIVGNLSENGKRAALRSNVEIKDTYKKEFEITDEVFEVLLQHSNGGTVYITIENNQLRVNLATTKEGYITANYPALNKNYREIFTLYNFSIKDNKKGEIENRLIEIMKEGKIDVVDLYYKEDSSIKYIDDITDEYFENLVQVIKKTVERNNEIKNFVEKYNEKNKENYEESVKKIKDEAKKQIEEEETKKKKQIEAKEKEEEKELNDKKVWINQFGSEYLKKVYQNGYKAEKQYIKERVFEELGKEWIIDYKNKANYSERKAPSEAALDELIELKKRGYAVKIVWLEKEIKEEILEEPEYGKTFSVGFGLSASSLSDYPKEVIMINKYGYNIIKEM